MQGRVQAVMTFTLAVLLATPAVAAEPGWILRLQGAWVTPNLSLPVVNSDIPVDVSGNGAPGAGAAIEYRFQRWLGVGIDALHARPELVLEADMPGGRRRLSDNLGFTPFSVGPVFHLTPGRAVDFSLTATVGFAVYGDLLFAADGQRLSLRGGTAFDWSLGAAVDIFPGASNWAIHAGVRRHDSTPEFSNRDNGAVGSAAVNPVVVTFGVAYRF